MNPWRWVDPRVNKVRLADLQAYLQHKGWTLKPNPNPKLLRYEEPRVGRRRPFSYVIPSSDQFIDFHGSVVDMITTFSEMEDRHPIDLLDDILRCGAESLHENGVTRQKDAKAVRLKKS
jgi:hypothetical protein